MANSTLPKEDRPDIEPDGGWFHPDEKAAGNPTDPRSNDVAAGDASDPRGPGPDTLSGVRGGEESGAGSNGMYNGSGDDEDDGFYKDDGKNKKKRRFEITRRQAAGGVLGGSLIGILIFGATITQGPFEFIHIAQLLEKFHFTALEDDQNSRLTRIARYLKDTKKPQNTRLGIVGNAMANKLETKINDATGLKSDYNTASGRFLGYEVDRTHDNFKGLSEAEIKTKLVADYGVDEGSIKVSGDKISFDPDTSGLNAAKGYLQQTRFARQLLKTAGLDKISTHVGARVLGERAGWTFHPIQKLDAAARAKIIEGGQAAKDKAKQQFNKDEVQVVENGPVNPADVKGENASAKDQKGNQDPAAGSAADQATSVGPDAQQAAQGTNDGDPEATSKFSDSLGVKAAGGTAGLIGVMCVIKNLGQHVEAVKFDKAELPMMRMAGQAFSVGSQVPSGQDISALQLGFYSDQLAAKDSNGRVTSTWNQAESIQAEEGHPNTGTDIPKAGQVFNGNPINDFTSQIPGLDTICSILGSPLGIVAGIISAPASFIVQGKLIDEGTKLAAGWLAGDPVNPLAAGADRGSFMNFGAKLSANDQAASVGGSELSQSDIAAIKSTDNGLDQADFDSKSIAYRLLNPNDSRTLASQFMDNHQYGSATQAVASMVKGFGSVFASALKLPGTLMASTVHAAPNQDVYHGLKTIGFKPSEMTDPRLANPFDNGCYVAGNCDLADGTHIDVSQSVLGGPNGSDYINRASDCFGVNISGNATDGWDINSTTKAVNMYTQSYPSNDCKDSGLGWLRLRFWLLDTATAEAYDCYQSNTDTADQSCQDVGYGAAASSDSGSSGIDTINGLTNPLQKIKGLQPERIDQGVDYAGSGPILAVGDGTIMSTTNSGWPGGTFIVIHLDKYPDKYVYVAENCQDIKVQVGDKVKAGDPLCTLVNAFPNLEIGWADGKSIGSALGHELWVGHDDPHYYTAYGENFSQLLQRLGAPPGTKESGAQKLGNLPSGWPSW